MEGLVGRAELLSIIPVELKTLDGAGRAYAYVDRSDVDLVAPIPEARFKAFVSGRQRCAMSRRMWKN
jgi:hypothetical protein